ncbi:MAG: hypothetical protein ACP5K7_02865 [Verrucomicrobiia bacterium]
MKGGEKPLRKDVISCAGRVFDNCEEKNKPFVKCASEAGILMRQEVAGRRGVALVITLILLSIITMLSVAFLLIARRERGQVTLTGTQIEAELAADAALERAKAEIVSRMVSDNSLLSFGLLVSTNQDKYPPNPTPADLANLLKDPRVPVFMNDVEYGGEGRFYLDLNRNGMFEQSYAGEPGDPEWIGILENPLYPHSGTNRFRQRYALIAIPIGDTLDINAIHNQAILNPQPGSTGFLRNQGVGSWEINLAAFLRSLNTNLYGLLSYNYAPLAPSSMGAAFEDARDILMYRYNRNLLNLPSALSFIGGGAVAFQNDWFDTYSDGPLMLGQYLSNLDLPTPDPISNPWSGSDNPNSYFDLTSELFDSRKVSTNFVWRLESVSTNVNNEYDRRTFYRLLSQLATDSIPLPDTNKIHLNYVNLPQSNIYYTNIYYTNFLSWRSYPEFSLMFFTNVANRLLSNQINEINLSLGFGYGTNVITNVSYIPVKFYTPEIHRFLQVAANIFDANWNGGVYDAPYPTVFRPVFTYDTNFDCPAIAGYRIETNAAFVGYIGTNIYSAFDPKLKTLLANQIRDDILIYNVPPIVGARKGYPNFNEFTVKTYVQVERKLAFIKQSTTPRSFITNQMYIIGISNSYGIEFWNSYSRPFPRNLRLFIACSSTVVLTNETGNVLFTNIFATNFGPYTIPANTWRGGSFIQTPPNNLVVLDNGIYVNNPPRFLNVNPNPGFDTGLGFNVPMWWMTISNRILCYLIDTSANRVVDFVCMDGLGSHIDLSYELMSRPAAVSLADTGLNDSMFWDTNRIGNPTDPNSPTRGVYNQILASMGRLPANWNSYGPNPWGQNKETAIDTFCVRMGEPPVYNPGGSFSTNVPIFQAPFTPMRKLYRFTTWQVNDPLVHYIPNQLYPSNYWQAVSPVIGAVIPTNSNLGLTNYAYRPWGGNPHYQDVNDQTSYDRRIKDPLVWSSDDWDFPMDEFPTIGWLGRVHRGTPWQTIYLRSEGQNNEVDDFTWVRWSGYPGSRLTHPTNDWKLVDIFITAPHPNATRGLLSINQTNIAAWSAVLSGALVLKPDPATTVPEPDVAPNYIDTAIEPESPEIYKIIDGINNYRDTKPNRRFTRLSEILEVPELTTRSPFVNYSTPVDTMQVASDAALERIPMQILSLLKVGEPRFLIYAYGQSLRPAPGSITFGPGEMFQLCTNYQVVGEAVIRTVIRVENEYIPGETNIIPRVITESFNLLPPQ